MRAASRAKKTSKLTSDLGPLTETITWSVTAGLSPTVMVCAPVYSMRTE